MFYQHKAAIILRFIAVHGARLLYDLSNFIVYTRLSCLVSSLRGSGADFTVPSYRSSQQE